MALHCRRGLSLALLLGAAAGCNSTPQHIKQATVLYYVGDYQGAERLIQPDTVKKNEGFVLNNCRFGSAALAAGNLEAAQQAFMAAYEVINSVKTNDGGRTLGATLVFEGVKVWKGEPFERAMAHYYLGLTMLIQGDYENARAAFRNSLFKLREYAKDQEGKPEADQYQQFESNFALGYFGLGFCYLRTHQPDLAEANFKEALKRQPSLSQVVEAVKRADTNTLIFVDYGQGPKREGKGWYNEESAFGPTPAEVGPVPPLNVAVDGRIATQGIHYDMVDTLAMAQDQRWQDIDTIRKTKAVIGTGAMAAGAGLTAYGADQRDTGMALAGVGTLLAGAALAASSQADLRYWEMLPRTVYVVPLALPPGEHTLQVNANGSTSAAFRAPIKAQGDTVLYVRLK